MAHLRRHRFRVALSVLALGLSGTSSASADQRGRPVVDSTLGYNIILSDRGSLLRGVSLAWDGGDPYGSLPKVIPTTAQLDRLASEFGLNTVHLYLEGNSSTNPEPVGANLADADSFVRTTAEAGLYLIITIGCNGENGSIHDFQRARDFWSLYADRYRDETHVLFEAHNEPAAYTPNQWTIDDWDRQAELYEVIRGAAPDSMVLLGSFMGFAGDPSFGADYLAQRGVSWENAGFAHHGYESKEGIENAISIMQSDPGFPPLLATEFWPGDTEGQGYNSMYESRLNGWMQFQWLGADDRDLDVFRSKITAAGTVWTPDALDARWPALGNPAIPEAGVPVGIFVRGADRFLRVAPDAGRQLRADRISYSGGGKDDAFIAEPMTGTRFRLRTPKGDYVATTGESAPLRAIGQSPENGTIFEWIQLPSGDHVVRAIDAGGHLVRWDPGSGRVFADGDDGRSRSSHLSLVTAAGAMPPSIVGDPYHGTPHPIPGRIQAEDFDLGGAGVSYQDGDPGNNGGAYRVLEDVDIEVTADFGGGYNVGWFGPGEWLDYTVEVPKDGGGEYLLQIRAASPGGSAGVGLRFDGEDPLGTIALPATGGYQAWTTLRRTVVLEPGVRVMRFENRGSESFNLNWIGFSEASCPADFDLDGVVDGGDLPVVLSSWGRCPVDCRADLNDDAMVDGADLSLILASWGVCP